MNSLENVCELLKLCIKLWTFAFLERASTVLFMFSKEYITSKITEVSAPGKELIS